MTRNDNKYMYKKQMTGLVIAIYPTIRKCYRSGNGLEELVRSVEPSLRERNEYMGRWRR